VKIDGTGKPITPASTGPQRPAEARTQPAGKSAGGTQVELSGLAGTLKELEATIASVPVVDSARVGEIKQAIADGQFKVNPERIADGLIESVREMLAAQSRHA